MDQVLHAGCGDEVHVFQSDAGLKGRGVEAGLGGEELGFFQRVVPVGVEVRVFVGRETYAVTEVMREAGGGVLFEMVGDGFVDGAAACAGFGDCLYEL